MIVWIVIIGAIVALVCICAFLYVMETDKISSNLSALGTLGLWIGFGAGLIIMYLGSTMN